MCSQSHRTWGNPPAGCHARRNHVPAAIDSWVIYKDTKTSTMCLAIVYFRSLKPLLINNCLGTIIIIIDVFRDVHNCTYNNGVKVKDTWYLVLEIFVQLRYICDYTQFVWKVPLYHITGIKYHGNCKMLFCYTKCLSKTKNAVKI